MGKDRVAYCVCVCVCSCVHTWGGTQCVTCVPDPWGQAGLLTSQSPLHWGQAFPSHLSGQSLLVWEAAPQFFRKLSLIASPYTARHMTGEGGVVEAGVLGH